MLTTILLLSTVGPLCGTYSTGNALDVLDVVDAYCAEAPVLPACTAAAAQLYGYTPSIGRRAWWVSQNCDGPEDPSKGCAEQYAIIGGTTSTPGCVYDEGDLDACAAAADPEGVLDEATVTWLCEQVG